MWCELVETENGCVVVEEKWEGAVYILFSLRRFARGLLVDNLAANLVPSSLPRHAKKLQGREFVEPIMSTRTLNCGVAAQVVPPASFPFRPCGFARRSTDSRYLGTYTTSYHSAFHLINGTERRYAISHTRV